MIPYLFHVSILVAACYLFYLLFLQKETYFQINRFVLIGCILVAFALPFLEIPQEWSLRDASISAVDNRVKNADFIPKNNNVIIENDQSEMAVFEKKAVSSSKISPNPIQKATSKLTIWKVLKYGYFIGLAIFSFNFLLQLVVLLFKIFTKPSIKDGNIRIVEIEKDKAPFSFLNSIFLNPEKYEWNTYNQILEHEKIHIREGHTWDILLAELLVIVQWFNPFAWWYRRAVENNLEYLTDQKMLAKGTNVESYQMNLLKVSVPYLPLSLTTNYNTSFLKKRIFMMNQKKSSASSSWKYFFLFPLLGLSVITFNSVAVTAQNAPIKQGSKIEAISEIKEATEITEAREPREIRKVEDITENQKMWSPYSQNIDLLNTKGEWEAKIEGDLICYQFIKRLNRGSVYWERQVCIDKPDFPKIDSHSFTMTRAAGTVDFKGKVTAKGGKGTYTFTPNSNFQNYLKSQGFDLDEKALFHCCLTDINKEYLVYLKQQNYDLSSKELTQFALHGITQESMEIYIPGMKELGFERVETNDLIALTIHEVELEYVAELKEMLQQDLTIDNIVAAKIHDIDPDYIKQFRAAGFENMDFDNLVGFAIHDISPKYIQSLKNAGLKNLDIDEITAAGIHSVDAAYIKKFQDAGFDGLDFDDLIGFAIHDIDPEYIESLQKAGMKNLDMNEITAAGIHGVDAAYIQEFQKAGLKDLDFDDLIGFAIHGIEPAYIQSLRNAGIGELDIEEITAAGIHGIEVEFIKEMKGAGFEDVNMEELVVAKIHGVDADFIKKYKKKDYNFKRLEDYVDLKLKITRREFNQNREE
jgi:hypothetical protein